MAGQAEDSVQDKSKTGARPVSVAEAAEALGVDAGTLRKRIARSLQKATEAGSEPSMFKVQPGDFYAHRAEDGSWLLSLPGETVSETTSGTASRAEDVEQAIELATLRERASQQADRIKFLEDRVREFEATRHLDREDLLKAHEETREAHRMLGEARTEIDLQRARLDSLLSQAARQLEDRAAEAEEGEEKKGRLWDRFKRSKGG